jgi:hypothetical protein
LYSGRDAGKTDGSIIALCRLFVILNLNNHLVLIEGNMIFDVCSSVLGLGIVPASGSQPLDN